ncbi:MAG: UDP-N-acetylglucosamine 2-epimerase (non-hydrolyzing) [Gemmatimonadota bacterium]
MPHIIHVAGARPNFMKIAPIVDAFAREGTLRQTLVHTGQHYDSAMSHIFFDELGIPRPDVDLGVGSASHAVQTARIMIEFEKVVLDSHPDLVLVVGDVNSTVACALVAAKLGVPVAHVEAGLRSFDWGMPEEINRVVTDRLSDLLFTTEESGNHNLRAEGVPDERIHFVGNVMIDTLLAHRDRALATGIVQQLGVKPGSYGVVTLHRPSNVDSLETLGPIAEALAHIAKKRPILFPAHPRTRANLERFGLMEALGDVRILAPLGYLEFLGLTAQAGFVLTDSGGIQEETTVLGVPCLTARPNTERPVTVTEGTNRLIEPTRDAILDAVASLENAPVGGGRQPPLWDGHAAERIVDVVKAFLRERSGAPVRT